jgi:hypothetical protein
MRRPGTPCTADGPDASAPRPSAQLLRGIMTKMSPRQCKWLVKIILKDLKVGEGASPSEAGCSGFLFEPSCARWKVAVNGVASIEPPRPLLLNLRHACYLAPRPLPVCQAGLSVERVLRDYHPDAEKYFNM